MKITLTLITLMLLLSCKKYSKRWTEVTIRVNNYLTGEPIDKNVICGVVYYKNKKLPWKKDGDVVLDSGSPVNGVYHYAFKAPKAIQQAEFDWDIGKLYAVDVKQFMYYDVGKKNEFQQYLVPMGFQKDIYRNVNCFNDNDSLYLFYLKNISLPNYTPSPGGYYLKGCDINIEGEYISQPIGEYVYKWSLTRNGITQYIIDTVVVKENEYTIYELDY